MVKYCMPVLEMGVGVCPLCNVRADAGTLGLLGARAARSAKERFLHNLPLGKQQTSGFGLHFVSSIVLKTFCRARSVVLSDYCERAWVALVDL